MTCLQDNREILRNLQISEILPDEQFSFKECLGISSKLCSVESEKEFLNREVKRSDSDHSNTN